MVVVEELVVVTQTVVLVVLLDVELEVLVELDVVGLDVLVELVVVDGQGSQIVVLVVLLDVELEVLVLDVLLVVVAQGSTAWAPAWPPAGRIRKRTKATASPSRGTAWRRSAGSFIGPPTRATSARRCPEPGTQPRRHVISRGSEGPPGSASD